MPTNEELNDAIKAAQAAGDKEAVQILQSELSKSRPIEEVGAEYEALPWYGKLGQAITDDSRLVAKGATFGWSPEIIASLHGMLGGEGDYATNVAEIQNRNAEAEARAGSAAIPAQLLGGLRTGKVVAGVGSIPERAIGSTLGPLAKAAAKYMPAPKLVGTGLGTIGSAATSGAIGGGAIGGMEAGAQGESVPEGIVKGALEGGVSNAIAGPLAKAGGWLVGKGVESTIGGANSKAAVDYIKEAAKKAGYDIEDTLTAAGVLSAERVKEHQRKKYRPTKY